MMGPLSQLVLLALHEDPITFVGSHLVSQNVAIVGSHLGSKSDTGKTQIKNKHRIL